jgi:FecR protein
MWRRNSESRRGERRQIESGQEAMRHLPLVEAPESIWKSIEAALAENQGHRLPRVVRWRWALIRWRWAWVASAILVLAAAAYWRAIPDRGTLRPRSGVEWEVTRLDGSPVVSAHHIRETASVRVGDWIETDSASRATVNVGGIGSVEVEQNTRLRVIAARPEEHRLALARGTIRATISAPPRLFFVDTAAGTAVDLGCEYALTTGENGSGVLHVTRGWVSFEWQGIDSLVPAGASCRLWPHEAPGIPYFDDAPESLKAAIENFGHEKAADSGLEEILRESRVRDTLSLWHLLARVEGRDRERVYDRMVALTPLPAGVSRELALKLDPGTLTRWKDALAWTW